jgi:hypothetical protein
MKASKHKVKRAKKTPEPIVILPGGLGEELLIGADAIAAYLGQPVRRVRHWINIRAIPLMKVGALWAATRTNLREHFAGGKADAA